MKRDIEKMISSLNRNIEEREERNLELLRMEQNHLELNIIKLIRPIEKRLERLEELEANIKNFTLQVNKLDNTIIEREERLKQNMDKLIRQPLENKIKQLDDKFKNLKVTK